MAASGTPWFRVYSQLRSHPKLEDLASALRVPKAHALGHLVMLWCWITDYAEDGDLVGIETTRIERAAGWEGKSGALVRALVGCRWLDGQSGSYRAHDWFDYAESYKRAQNKKNSRVVSEDSPATVGGQSQDSPPERIGKEVEDKRGKLAVRSNQGEFLSLSDIQVIGHARKWPMLTGELERKLSSVCPVRRDLVDEAMLATAGARKPGWPYFVPTLIGKVQAESKPPRLSPKGETLRRGIELAMQSEGSALHDGGAK